MWEGITHDSALVCRSSGCNLIHDQVIANYADNYPDSDLRGAAGPGCDWLYLLVARQSWQMQVVERVCLRLCMSEKT